MIQKEAQDKGYHAAASHPWLREDGNGSLANLNDVQLGAK
jgi:hypothetical protein